ncbi:dienelactone hydrolase family protein [Acinetobacter sp. NIPH 2699]|uniref:dienelactone hydrolase family protein n=1 Tax=Acinetobacter sp. NIPH 2699 TaxID=2923433 RepID=UPI001F4AD49A|nr:dienelactone hydrolase family protein [Acinetobacter sp. NIPH 2699]MCH7337641.1 dienelactone hydrolase family protein [Acinetobacter sp. NIPH 2699]
MEIKTIALPTRQIEVEVYAPAQTSEKQPAILLLHELFGILDVYREDAQDLADRGYLVYVPNLFSGGAVKYCIRAMVSKASRVNAADSEVNQEIHVLLDALKTDPRSNGRLGMLGQCLTGGYVIQMAKRDDMLAPVVYHHSLGVQGAGVPKKESLDEIRILQGHWSTVDPFCPAAKRNKLIQQLGDRVEAYTYNMPHGFRSVSRGLPDAKVVWQRTVEFFDRELKQNVI